MTPIKFHNSGNDGTANFPGIKLARKYVAKSLGAVAIMAASGPLQGHDMVSGVRRMATTSHGMAPSKNEIPIAVLDHVDLKRSANAFNALANDSDADGDRLTMVAAIADYGAVAFTPEGLLAYAKNPGPVRPDNITYTVSDGRGGFAKGSVKIVMQ